MDLKQVEKSLEKYWEGTSSLEEEMQLRDFFTYGELPAHLEMYKEMFSMEEIPLNPSLGKDFDKKILSKISEKEEPSTRWNIFRIAAIGLILLITAITIFKKDNQVKMAEETESIQEDTYSDPEEALEETKRAFMLIAEAMNKGEEPLQNLSQLDKANQKIKKKDKAS
jgi:hypothetical protein